MLSTLGKLLEDILEHTGIMLVQKAKGMKGSSYPKERNWSLHG